MSAAEIYDELAPHDLADLKRAVALLSGGNFAVRASQQLGRSAASLSYFIPAAVRSAALDASESALAAAMRWAVRHVSRRPPVYGRSRALLGGLRRLRGDRRRFRVDGLDGRVAGHDDAADALDRRDRPGRRRGPDRSRQPRWRAWRFSRSTAAARTPRSIPAISPSAPPWGVRSAKRPATSRREKASTPARPRLCGLISLVAARFGLVVSEKFVAQALPVVGAAFGAGLNLTFTAHFQNLARGHFIMRRLERLYGAHAVREAAMRVRPAGGV